MPTINKTEQAQQNTKQMYSLVNDINRYQEFIPWCVSSSIIDGEPEQWLIAKLGFEFHGLQQSFTTRNTLNPNSNIDIKLVDGPFEHLAGTWQFTENDLGCLISLSLEYRFSNNLISNLFEPAFAKISNMLVQTFKDRADELFR